MCQCYDPNGPKYCMTHQEMSNSSSQNTNSSQSSLENLVGASYSTGKNEGEY